MLVRGKAALESMAVLQAEFFKWLVLQISVHMKQGNVAVKKFLVFVAVAAYPWNQWPISFLYVLVRVKSAFGSTAVLRDNYP